MAGAPSPPFQWMDDKGGFHGMGQDYRKIIERELGVRLEPEPAPTWDVSLAQLRRGECDVSLLTAATPSRSEFLRFTQPLLTLPLAIITQRSAPDVHGLTGLAGRRVAVGRGWPLEEQLRKEHPEIILVPRDDVGSAISAVALGGADAYVGELASATQAIDQLGVRNLKISGEAPSSFPFCIAVRKDWPEAVALLDKVISGIPAKEQAAIRKKWISVQGFGWPLDRVLVLLATTAIGIVALTLAFSNRRLAREVLERRKTEAALRESEERWGFALEGSRDGVWDWNVKTNEVFFSKRFRTMLNYSEAELPGRFEEWTSRIHPDDRELVLGEVERHLRGDTRAYEVAHRVVTKGNTYRWILARGRVVCRDAAGAPVRMVGTHTDITERRRVEEELREHREKLEQTVRARTEALERAERGLRQITDSIPGAVYQFVKKTDGTFAFTFCSEGMEAMVGVPAEDAVRDVNAVWAMVHPDDMVELVNKADYSAKTLTGYLQDLRICQPDGRKWWIQAQSTPQRQPDGSTVWNGNIIDITDRKRLGAELAQSKQAADAANRAKSVFLANMSHEIRTPMNAILGFSQLLLRDPGLTRVQRSHLETIARSGEHLLALINDILEISKIEAGRVALHLTSFDLRGLLDDVDRLFRMRAESKGLGFSIECDQGMPPFIVGDESKLRQILINLIGNAVKFTERGGISVRIAAQRGDDTPWHLMGSVADSGPGIDAADLPKLFTQFEQTETGQRAGVGTGLGLAISREFARLMGGDIVVESELGRGATFRFDLLAEEGEASVRIKAERRSVRHLCPGHEGMRVLIADDQAENRELLEHLLKPVGFETRSVSDGVGAVAMFSEWRPQIGLLDLRMPDVDGLEVIRRIRQLPTGAKTPIIVVTASAFEENRKDVIAAGGDDFLGKPFREQDLFEKIGRLTGAEFEYEEEPVGEQNTGERQPLAMEDAVAAIPLEIRTRLTQAAVRADFDKMLEAVAEISDRFPEAAPELRRRVESFEYQSLIELLQKEKNTL
jgi:PAS domain S-box-containing protein